MYFSCTTQQVAKNVAESDEGENESGKSSPKTGGKGRKLDMKPSLTQQGKQPVNIKLSIGFILLHA